MVDRWWISPHSTSKIGSPYSVRASPSASAKMKANGAHSNRRRSLPAGYFECAGYAKTPPPLLKMWCRSGVIPPEYRSVFPEKMQSSSHFLYSGRSRQARQFPGAKNSDFGAIFKFFRVRINSPTSLSSNSCTPRSRTAITSVIRGPYTAYAAATRSLPFLPRNWSPSQIPKIEPIAKLQSTSELPSSGSYATAKRPRGAGKTCVPSCSSETMRATSSDFSSSPAIILSAETSRASWSSPEEF